MITCPFCCRLVEIHENNSGAHLYENEPDDFNCHTYVDVAPGRRWCHYQRRYINKLFEYEAVIPPFIITLKCDYYPVSDPSKQLTTKENKLEVKQFSINDTGMIIPSPYTEHSIFQNSEASFQDFIDAYNRFKSLKVFS